MDPRGKDLAIEFPEDGWSDEKEIVDQLEEPDLGSFSGISLGIGLGLAIWVTSYLLVRLF